MSSIPIFGAKVMLGKRCPVLIYGFERMELTRIGAVVFTGNEASKALLVKQGFQQEGLLRNYMVQDGKPHDTNVYSIVK